MAGTVEPHADGALLIAGNGNRIRIDRGAAGLTFRWMVTVDGRKRAGDFAGRRCCARSGRRSIPATRQAGVRIAVAPLVPS